VKEKNMEQISIRSLTCQIWKTYSGIEKNKEGIRMVEAYSSISMASFLSWRHQRRMTSIERFLVVIPGICEPFLAAFVAKSIDKGFRV
jgi:hypothetical protein